MLTKTDFKRIEEIIHRNITDAFSEFFQSIVAPYFDRNENDHAEILKKFKENDEDHKEIFRRLDRNQEEHYKIFEKLDSIEEEVKGYGKRIKKLETFAAS